MDAPSTVLLLVGLDGAYLPYGPTDFTPDTTCTSSSTFNLDPEAGDLGPQSSEECITAAGFDGARGDPGDVFPGIALGLSVERDRVRLTGLFTLSPAIAPTEQTDEYVLTPDLAFGGQLSLEVVVVNERFSFALGGLADIKAFSARGSLGGAPRGQVKDGGGDTRLTGEAGFAGGPAISLGWNEPKLLFRGFSLLGTEGQLGGGVAITWAPWAFPV